MRVSERTARRISAAPWSRCRAGVLVGVVGYAAVERNPISEVSDKWDEFKQGGSGPQDGSEPLSGGVSTYRYDYWRSPGRVRAGAGAGAGPTTSARYLRGWAKAPDAALPAQHRAGGARRDRPIGGLLLLGAFVGRRWSPRSRAAPAPTSPARAPAPGVLMFAYWLAHGSLDWFWEFPGLAGPAWPASAWRCALRGGAPAPSPRGPPGAPLWPRPARRRVRSVLLIATSMPALAPSASSGAAPKSRPSTPDALDHLDRAADLNPLSPSPTRPPGSSSSGAAATPPERKLRGAFDRDSRRLGPTCCSAVLAAEPGAQEARAW